MGEPLQLVQDFVKSRNTLFNSLVTQNSGFVASRKYTDLMDWLIRSLFLKGGFKEKAREIEEERVAIIALGSYGRREMSFGSDVDVLVVHQEELSPEMSDNLSRVLYALWDAKLDVGHSILTVQGSIRLAMNDFRFLTSAMDARYLMGSKAFFREFKAAFWAKIESEKGALLDKLLGYQERRKEKYGNQEFFAEPDIKEGLGGLRDLHFMTWMAKVFFKVAKLKQIKENSAFSHFGLDKLHHSQSFLLKVRLHLHLLAGGRREDRLILPYQEKISRSLGYRAGVYNTGPEKFERDLHLHLNSVRYGREEYCMKTMDLIEPPSAGAIPDRLPGEFQVVKGNVVLRGESLLEESPLVVLKAFKEANERDLFLGSGLIWEATKKVAMHGPELLKEPDAKKIFLDIILNPRNPKVLRLALEIGLVNLFIPEFKKIRNLAQFSHYHVETVDFHSLKTLEVAYDISQGSYDDRWPLFKQVFGDLEHPEWLFLVCLLHDIGKGYRGDHSKRGAGLVRQVLRRLGIEGDALKVIPFLIRYHLLLVNVSQRRDLNEEKTSIQVAQTIRDTEALRLLFLLTVADSIATGPMASSDWKIMLLIELFFKVRHILTRGTLASPDATKMVEENRRVLSTHLKERFGEREITGLMDQVSPRYFLNTPLEDMKRHFNLALTMGERKLSWVLEKLKDAPVTRVILCTHDKPGLFWKMVGVFTLNNIKVLSGNIFTLKNGLAFDTYEVTNPLDPLREQEMWERIYNDALNAMEDRLPLDELIGKKTRMILSRKDRYMYPPPKRIKIDNRASDFFTILEVSGKSRTGLLYDLAKKIFSLGLDIRFAKINTDTEKTTGVFYVRDGNGQKIYEDSGLEQVREEILSIME